MGFLTVGFIFVCALLVLTVLIQKPQGGGLAGAFGGGAGSGQTAFGTKTGDALTVLTIIVFAVFLAFAIVLNLGVKAAHTNPALQPTSAGPGGGSGTTPAAPASTTPANQPSSGQPAATPPATEGSVPVQAPASSTPPASIPSNPEPVPQPASSPPTQPQPSPEPPR